MSLPSPFQSTSPFPSKHVPPPHLNRNELNKTKPPFNKSQQQTSRYSFRPNRQSHFPNLQQFSCKYCNIDFFDQIELQTHRRSHKKCPYDDCVFNANEVTISNHIKKVHIKVQDLTTPEQIEKWREERRKRYPTAANVQLRQQIQEMKLKRGEKLHDAKGRFGDHQQREFVKNMGGKRQKQHNQKKASPRKKQKQQRDDKSEIPEEINKILDKIDNNKTPMKFKETQQLDDYKKPEKIKEENEATQSGLSLIAGYGSDDSEAEDVKKVDEFPEKSCKVKEDSCEISEDNCEDPEEIPTQRVDTQPQLEVIKKIKQNPPAREKKVKKNALDYSKLRTIKSTNPFLEKLLHREIVHERNYLLQCVNYVVKNNFFGVGQNDTKN